MLKNSFQHIPGIGAKTERQLWTSGISSWQDFSGQAQPGIPPEKFEMIKKYTRESEKKLSGNKPTFFSDLLPPKEHWRLFPDFRAATAYIDIETTGLEEWSQITTIALYDGNLIKYYVQGRNLEAFIDDIQDYTLIVTFNGKTFDVPFIEKHFNTKLNHAHIDLRYVLKSLGYSGGLKKCEKSLGIDRGDLDGVDGYAAILLWRDYRQNQNEKALETLLAYNIEDVVNLEILMVLTYNMKIKETPFSQRLQLAMPPARTPLFEPDLATVEKIKRQLSSLFA